MGWVEVVGMGWSCVGPRQWVRADVVGYVTWDRVKVGRCAVGWFTCSPAERSSWYPVPLNERREGMEAAASAGDAKSEIAVYPRMRADARAARMAGMP